MRVWVWWHGWQYYAVRPWLLVKHTYKNLKWMWQRATRGWSDNWGWDIHHVISDMMPELIEDMIDWGHGYPVTVDNTMEDLIALEPNLRMFWHANQAMVTEETPEPEQQRWHLILREIAEGFRAAERLSEGMYLFDELQEEWDNRYPGIQWSGVTESGEFFVDDRYTELEKELKIKEREAELYKEDMDKFNRGMKLFHQFYFDLWD